MGGRDLVEEGVCRGNELEVHTSWRAAYDDAADALVDTFEASGTYEALRRLQARLHSVYREEKQVDRCPGDSPGL